MRPFALALTLGMGKPHALLPSKVDVDDTDVTSLFVFVVVIDDSVLCVLVSAIALSLAAPSSAVGVNVFPDDDGAQLLLVRPFFVVSFCVARVEM